LLEFILAVSLQEPCCDTYIGTFPSCEQAESYYEEHLKDYKGYSCLYVDYVMLPKDFKHNYIQTK